MTLRITTVFRGESNAPRCGGEDWGQRSCTDDEGSVSPHGCLGPQKKGPSSRRAMNEGSWCRPVEFW